MEFSIRDELRHSVEFASHGKNTVIYDDLGNPNVMYLLQKYDLGYLNLELDKRYGENRYKFGSGVHPAFIMDGKEVGEIYISKYENSLGEGGAPVSLPADSKITEYHAYEIEQRIRKKGKHWRLMSNAEYTALILLSWANDTLPLPSNLNVMGRYDNEHVAGYNRRFIMPSGIPVSMSHDGTKDGVMGLCGNSYNWVSGLRSDGGSVRIAGRDGIPTNDYTHDWSENNYIDTGIYWASKIGFTNVKQSFDVQRGIHACDNTGASLPTTLNVIPNAKAVGITPVMDDNLALSTNFEAFNGSPYALRGILNRWVGDVKDKYPAMYLYAIISSGHFDSVEGHNDNWYDHSFRATYIPSWEYKD